MTKEKTFRFSGLILMSIAFHFNSIAQTADTKSRVAFEQGQLISSPTGRIDGDKLYLSNEKGDFFVVGVWDNEESGKMKLPIVQSGVVMAQVGGQEIKKGDYLTSDGQGKLVLHSGTGLPCAVAMNDWKGDAKFLMVRIMVGL